MAQHPSPPLAYFAGLHGGRFTYQCHPCREFSTRPAGEVCAIWGEELTLANLKRILKCPVCRMPVDGVHRTFEFSSTDYLWRLHQEGFKTDHSRKT